MCVVGGWRLWADSLPDDGAGGADTSPSVFLFILQYILTYEINASKRFLAGEGVEMLGFCFLTLML